MKTIFISLTIPVLFFFAFVFAAAGAPFPPAPERNYELMKCNGRSFGTIWASFGRQYRSDSERPVYFPTEILVFSPDLNSRLLFPNINEALKIEVLVRSRLIRMKFSVPHGESSRTHLLQLLQAYPDDNRAFLGNWTVSENGKEQMDEVACSLN